MDNYTLTKKIFISVFTTYVAIYILGGLIWGIFFGNPIFGLYLVATIISEFFGYNSKTGAGFIMVGDNSEFLVGSIIALTIILMLSLCTIWAYKLWHSSEEPPVA